MHIRHKVNVEIVCSVLCLSSSFGRPASAQVGRTYIGPVDGFWSPTGIPGGDDSVTIPDSVGVTFDDDYALNSSSRMILTTGVGSRFYIPSGDLSLFNAHLSGTTYQSGGILDLEREQATIDGTYILFDTGEINDTALPDQTFFTTTISGNFYQGNASSITGGSIEVTGHFAISGGTDVANWIFDQGAVVTQSGGTITEGVINDGTGLPFQQRLEIGFSAWDSQEPSSATYYLQGGYLEAPEIGGTTVFYQSGGTADFLAIGSANCQVQYFLTGGTVTGGLTIDPGNGSGVFRQTGGEVTVSGLNVTNGTYEFVGGSVTAESLNISGIFNSAGSLSASEENISGSLTQTGGTNQNIVPSYLLITGTGEYSLISGSLTGAIKLNITKFAIDANPAGLTPPDLAVTDYTQFGATTLAISDLLPGSSALLNCSDSAAIAGTLSVSLEAAYTPEYGDVFVLIQSPSLSGVFNQYLFPTLPDGLYFRPIYAFNSFSLEIVPEPIMGTTLIAALGFLCNSRGRFAAEK